MPLELFLKNGIFFVLTDLIFLKVEFSTLANMLVSGLESIWNATEQWWFSSGEMSL